MTSGPVELAERWMEAVMRRDGGALAELAHPDLIYSPYLAKLGGGEGVYRGKDGARRYARDLDEAWEWYEIETERCREVDGHVLFTGHLRAMGRASGLEVEERIIGVYRIRDDRIAAFDLFDSETEALQALSPSTKH